MSSEPKKPNPDAEKAKYLPTAREQAALDKFAARRAANPPAPRIKVRNDGKLPELSPDHPDKPLAQRLLMEALGTASSDFVHGLLSQLANAGSQGRAIDEAGLNFMLSVIKGIKPKDQLEAMLAAQMAGVHMATMTFARRLNHVETIQQQDSAERALNKLARTFAMQMEALKRYRTGGEQKVTVHPYWRGKAHARWQDLCGRSATNTMADVGRRGTARFAAFPTTDEDVGFVLSFAVCRRPASAPIDQIGFVV